MIFVIVGVDRLVYVGNIKSKKVIIFVKNLNKKDVVVLFVFLIVKNVRIL